MLSGWKYTSKDSGGRQMNEIINPVLKGGLGEKVSNGGTQYYFQDRVYSSESIAVSVTVAFNPWYLIKVKEHEICSHIENRKK